MMDIRFSPIFETEAILLDGSPESWNLPFYNLVILGKTSLSPLDLLAKLKQIESRLGRDLSAPRYSPRLIDIDILGMDQIVFSHEKLIIPHKELINRPFLRRLMALLKPEWHYELKDTENCFTKTLLPFPQLVGIINVTPDSFSDGGAYLNADQAIQRIHELTNEGASVIDIGAQSTRPSASRISPKEEWERLKPIFDFLAKDFLTWPSKPFISVDSYYPEVIEKALECYPIDWINDVQGNEDLLQLIANSPCKIILHHSLGIPPSKEHVLPLDKCPISSLSAWAEKKFELFQSHGIAKDKIIIDPGIGFGKTAVQSFSILRNIKELKKLGCEILVGHSRKSFLSLFSTKSASERDLETLGVSRYLVQQGVDYLRVHQVESHHRLLALEGVYAS